ncbi:MAG: DUF3040 domain-containing protein [Micrococcales bacterium]
MALSDREKKVLEELERGLYADDAEFAERVKATSEKPPKRTSTNSTNPAARLVAGSALAVAGLSVLILAVTIQVMLIGIVGFIIMLIGLVIGSSNWSNSSLSSKPAKSKTAKPGTNFFEDRWNRRFDR